MSAFPRTDKLFIIVQFHIKIKNIFVLIPGVQKLATLCLNRSLSVSVSYFIYCIFLSNSNETIFNCIFTIFTDYVRHLIFQAIFLFCRKFIIFPRSNWLLNFTVDFFIFLCTLFHLSIENFIGKFTLLVT